MAQLGFWHFATENPEQPALIARSGDTLQQLSRGELLAQVNRLAHGLRARGLKTGDVVALCAPNGVESFELYLAAIQVGLYLVPINWHLAAPEIDYILRDSDARLFVTHPALAETAARVATSSHLSADQLFSIGTLPGYQCYRTLKQNQPATLPEERQAGQIMNYTSGTTGRPKAVKRALPAMSPDDLYSIIPSMLGATFGISADEHHIHYCGSPLYHAAVMSWAGNSLHLGHTVVCVDHWDAEQMLADIETFGISNSHMVPTQFIRLLKLSAETRQRYDTRSLRKVIHAAAPCPPDIKQQLFDWWGPVIYEYYAGTEGGSAICTPQDWLRYPGTVGKAPASGGIRILNDAGEDLPPNTTGTVYLKVMDGLDFEYKGDPEKTRANRVGNYFTLGDVGHLNDEGFLFLTDRKIDMIISGGANIYPAEIEHTLILHPDVMDCAVFGVPDDDWGEAVKAVVQLRQGVAENSSTREALLDFLEQRIARMKLPRSVDFVRELPRDPNGKLYKRRLRDHYWQNREAKV